MLTVYRASAGAGKTYKLTGEYLKLLFAGEQNYRHILAVTFTNKATGEMKSRIIEELYNLARSDAGSDAGSSASGYVDMLGKEYGMSGEEIRLTAKKTLTNILHDYASFNISTIDRFFQQVMRAFTREIGLQGGYGIEMDQDLALSEAIDNMLGDLDKPESKELLGWLIRFAGEKVENGGEWNLRRQIMALSREIFKESYKASSEKINPGIADKETLEDYKEELYAIIRSKERELGELGREGCAILEKYALSPSDFKWGSRSPIFYLRLFARGEVKEPPASFAAMGASCDACYTKTTPAGVASIICCAFEDGLGNCLRRIAALFDDMTGYYSAKEIVRNYYTLGILSDISRQVAAYRKENNIMLIADTTELLNKIIDGSDAPFIYEKTGTRINHYMIDEFQDTSDMQWSNFRPLIAESLANNCRNMIVGDVKQSIYRFRNSNWKLLDHQVRADFLPQQVSEETLKENWRSLRSVVDFNNTFFGIAPAILQEAGGETGIVEAYAGNEQSTPPALQDTKGHVKVDFLDADNAGDAGDAEDWEEEAMLRLPVEIERLQQSGYRPKDIAILVRTNREGATVADTLLTYKQSHPDSPYRFDIVSDDALYISASPAVRLIVAMMNHLVNPGNPTARRLACLSYYIAAEGNMSPDGSPEVSPEGLASGSPVDFPDDIQLAVSRLERQSLYEMIEGIVRLFASLIGDGEEVFVQAFLDMALEFSQKENTGPERFLKWWDETGSRKTIATPDGQDAIRILTIHKSKGLGFKAVIIPLCDWGIDHKPSQQVIIWCHPLKAPFDRLYLLPIRYGQGLAKTIFAKDYLEERLNASIDSLNTLYVAFTRAKEELIVIAPRPKKTDPKTGAATRIASIADLLWESIRISFTSFDHTTGAFETGTSGTSTASASGTATASATAIGGASGSAGEIRMGRITPAHKGDRMQLHLHGKKFFFDDTRRKHGALMHEILCTINTAGDIGSSVGKFLSEGIIGREEAAALETQLKDLLSTPDVASWYDGKARVLNEVDILFDKGQSRRPDRVMIYPDKVVVVDYKFGAPSDAHRKQLEGYINLIRRMGYPTVEGYVWYCHIPQPQAVFKF
ncbi:MAG: UvrD-helicase domain-containing protein [Tannerellaceae bacterium]|jgi:ATP-dependent exoDNAse (exonuclease V) beta subunit|nr:UvrD-helicase domain-containing protein [Tannerellaceae bacterium]